MIDILKINLAEPSTIQVKQCAGYWYVFIEPNDITGEGYTASQAFSDWESKMMQANRMRMLTSKGLINPNVRSRT